jgi:trafficking protein particle complex subunit 9
MLFEFNAAAPTEAHLSLAPFELFREPSVVLGVADVEEYVYTDNSNTITVERKQEFVDITNALRDKYPRSLLHRVILFEDPASDKAVNLDDDLFLIPRASKNPLDFSKVIQEISISLLLEWSSYAKSIQSLPSISSPTVPKNQIAPAQWFGDDGQLRNRPGSQITESSRSSPLPGSKELHRMSMPVFSSPSNNSSDRSLRADSPVTGRTPAKTFEEITATHLSGSTPSLDKANSRPGSLTPSREGRDKVPVFGFGSDSLSERTRGKGRGRVGVVLASVYLQAGRWPDAFRESAESAMKSRSYGDHLWHAKSLENVVISMLLLLWSGMEFQVCLTFSITIAFKRL